MNKIIPIFIVLTSFVNVTIAQNRVEEVVEPQVALIASAHPDSILLRWGATTPMAWELSNQYGYMIERVTILRDFKLLEKPERAVLTSDPIKPWPMEQWRMLVDENDYGAVAGQALYGETFEVTESMSTDMMQVVNKAKELEMRFSFALFAADQSLEVAKASGLYFVDKDVKEGEKYLYRVYSKVPEQTLKIDTGYVYIGTMDYAPLPKPQEVQAKAADKVVELSWNFENLVGIYNAYNLERADDGKNFEVVNQKPIVNTFQGDGPKTRLIFRTDSLPKYNVEYSYRVRGVTSFGELGPPSDTVTAMAFVTNNLNPVIIEKENVDNKSIRISWEFDVKHESKIKGFSLLRSSGPDSIYDTLAYNIRASDRSYVDKSPLLANYYIVAAEDYAGNYKNSFAALAQLVDSIPPAPPTGLIGIIDTTGLVTLTWKMNSEEDLQGYRIYRANFEDEEYSQITVAPVREELFYDSIPLKNLTPQIYYKIMALDERDNPSDFSTPIRLMKPDLLPPVPPVIEAVESGSNGVALTIIPSSSTDVVEHMIYRRNVNEANWRLVASYDSIKNQIIYNDTTLLDYKVYTYTVVAIDASGLESERSKIVEGKKIDQGIRDRIENIYAEANRKERLISIQWKYERNGVDKFLIFRKGEEQEEFRLYKTLSANEKSFKDRNLQINTIYKYKIMAVYGSGARSPLSEEIRVNF